MLKWQITITEQKVFKYKTCQDVKINRFTQHIIRQVKRPDSRSLIATWLWIALGTVCPHSSANSPKWLKYNICINVSIIKIYVPRAHEVKNERVIAKRTSQIMKYGQDVYTSLVLWTLLIQFPFINKGLHCYELWPWLFFIGLFRVCKPVVTISLGHHPASPPGAGSEPKSM